MLILDPFFYSPLLLFLLLYCLLRCLASPLRQIPGPPLSLFTSWTLKYHELRANRTRYIHALHRTYGPAVRIAPNEVAFASAGAVKEIYCSGGSGYDKTEFYDLFKVYGRRTMFTTLNKEDHAKRRRILADRYANSNVMRGESLSGIEVRSRKFLKLCQDSVGKAHDVFLALHAYAFDCVTHHLFQPYGSNSLENSKDAKIMHEVTFDDSLQNRLISHYCPALHKAIARFLYLFYKPRETPLADSFVLNAATQTDAAPFSLLSRMREHEHTNDVDSRPAQQLEHLDIAAEGLDHMAAGIDTTGDLLCFAMWELSQRRSMHLQKRLQVELRKSDAPFDKLPFLDRVVTESLRCFAAIPMSLPRYVPAGGRVIDGFYLPAGTVVSCQAYSVHRMDEGVFPEPERFKPDRWADEDREREAERRRLLFAFANGGRGCIGKHLAMAEMKILLRDVYSTFTTTPDPCMREEEMELADQLISSQPRGKRCLLRFEPLGR